MSIYSRISETARYGLRAPSIATSLNPDANGSTRAQLLEVASLAVRAAPGQDFATQRQLAKQQLRVDSYKSGIRAYDEPVRNRYGRIIGHGGATLAEGPHAQISRDIFSMRAEARAFSRNNPHAKHNVRIWRDWIVGSGINFAPRFPGGGKKAQERFERTWKEFFETRACDASGHDDFYGLTLLAVMTMFECGEVIIRVRNRYFDDVDIEGRRLPVPIQFEVLEPDYLYDGPTPKLERENHTYFNGVEFDVKGMPVAYWLYKNHPGDLKADRSFTRVPVVDPDTKATQIIHLFDMERPGQPRGLPRGAIVVETLMAAADLRKSVLNRKRVEAKIQHFLKVGRPDLAAKQQIFGPQEIASFMSSAAGAGGAPLPSTPAEINAVAETVGASIVDGQMVVVLPEAWDYEAQKIETLTDYAPIMADQHRTVAIGYGIPYELSTGDLKATTYSSGKIGMLQFKREVGYFQRYIITALCVPAWRSFVLAGFRANLWQYADIPCDFRPDALPALEPEKEEGARVMALNNGTLSWEDACREKGLDPDEQEAKLERDIARWKRLGVEMRIGVGMYQKTGTPQAAAAPEPTQDTDIADTGTAEDS